MARRRRWRWWRKQRRKALWRSPELSVRQILAWADDFHERASKWPVQKSGPIAGSLGEKWVNIDKALRYGRRGLPGGSSLAQLLAERRGKRNPARLPALTEEQIIAWADAHRQRTGRWPGQSSGPILEAPGETWSRVQTALREGLRGLAVGTGLAPLLARERGARNRKALPKAKQRANPGLGGRPPPAHRPLADPGIRPSPRCSGRDLADDRSEPARGSTRPSRKEWVNSVAGQEAWGAQPHGPSGLDHRADPRLGQCPPPAHRPMADP